MNENEKCGPLKICDTIHFHTPKNIVWLKDISKNIIIKKTKSDLSSLNCLSFCTFFIYQIGHIKYNSFFAGISVCTMPHANLELISLSLISEIIKTQLGYLYRRIILAVMELCLCLDYSYSSSFFRFLLIPLGSIRTILWRTIYKFIRFLVCCLVLIHLNSLKFYSGL